MVCTDLRLCLLSGQKAPYQHHLSTATEIIRGPSQWNKNKRNNQLCDLVFQPENLVMNLYKQMLKSWKKYWLFSCCSLVWKVSIDIKNKDTTRTVPVRIYKSMGSGLASTPQTSAQAKHTTQGSTVEGCNSDSQIFSFFFFLNGCEL